MGSEQRQDRGLGLLRRQQVLVDLTIIVGVNLLAIVGGLFGIFMQGMGQPRAAFVCAGAFLAIGVLVGFLFGIPKVLQKDSSGPPGAVPIAAPIQAMPQTGMALPGASKEPLPAATGKPQAPAAAYRIEVNTNLEQISDWLTKIIVGLGLVELRSMPEHLQRLAAFLGVGLRLPVAVDAAPAVRESAMRSAEVLALLTVVYFMLIGFFSGYLMTRTYLTGAFRRADEDNLDLQVPVGSERNKDLFMLSFDQAEELKRWQFDDLREQVISLQERLTQASGKDVTAGEGPESPGPQPLAVSRILWVDDQPKNNSYLIAYLDSLGVKVINAVSSDEAMSKLLSMGIDCVVTDMHHPDSAKGPEPAGIALVRNIRGKNSQIPIYIFTSRQSAQDYAQAARDAGVTEILDSPTQLLAAFRHRS